MAALYDPVEALTLELAGINDRDHRRNALLKHAAQFGVTHFAYLNTTQPRAPFHVETTYPSEWVSRYLERNYLEADAVSLEGRRAPVPFQWRTALALPTYGAEARMVFDEAAAFGLHDGYTVPIHAAAGLSVVSMAVDDLSLFKPRAARQRHTVHLLAMLFHLACDRALADALPPAPRLSPREREVLLWAAQGKTGWEIAQILKLTERTVTYHVENAKTKLGAGSRSQAVVMALSLGLIQP